MADYNFDLHCHPFGKHFLTDEDFNKKKTPWEKVKGGVLQKIAPILSSQSSLSQLREGNVKLSVTGICAIERAFSNFWLIEDIAGLFTVLDRRFLKKINQGDAYHYNRLFHEELEFIFKTEPDKRGNYFKVLNHIEEIDLSDRATNLILSIEGSHALFTNLSQSNDVLVELVKLKNYPNVSFLYLTLTHLSKNDLCNHAYGAKMTEDPSFKPNLDIKGLSLKGREVIQKAYSTVDGKRILIDIKHMSLSARKEFYDFRKKEGFENIPILASHVGVTGISYDEFDEITWNFEQVEELPELIKVEYKDVPGICGDGKPKNRTEFNPWSINMYDEDIKEVINSGGLIGISLDQRILGFTKGGEEFFRKDEFKENWNHTDEEIATYSTISIKDLDWDEEDDYDFEGDVNSRAFLNNARKHKRYLCNNILHVVKVAGAEAWKQMCVGSDFDGLIDAVNNCKTAADLPDLEEDLIETLETMIKEETGTDYHVIDLKTHVRDFMYNNGERFLKRYFTLDYLTKGE